MHQQAKKVAEILQRLPSSDIQAYSRLGSIAAFFSFWGTAENEREEKIRLKIAFETLLEGITERKTR